MGLITQKDIFSGNYITAEIRDSGNFVHFVPIKHTVGDYFVTDIDNQIYCFKIEGSQILTYKETLKRSFRKINYTTQNYLPINAGKNAEIAEMLKLNNLPKRISRNLLGTLKLVSKKEKEIFKPDEEGEYKAIEIISVINEFAAQQEHYPEQVQTITNYLSHLQAKQIVTPVSDIVDYLDDTLLATDPKFLGDIVSQIERTDVEHKKISNTPIKSKREYMKIIAIVMGIVIVGGVGYWAYSSGAFSHLIPSFGGTDKQTELMKKYPTPEAMKKALDSGQLKDSDLTPDLRTWVQQVKLPTTP